MTVLFSLIGALLVSYLIRMIINEIKEHITKESDRIIEQLKQK